MKIFATWIRENDEPLFARAFAFAPAVPNISATGAPVPTTQQQVFQTFEAKWVTDFDVAYKFNKNTKLQFNVKNITNRNNDYAYSSTVSFGTPRSAYLNLKVDL